MQKKKFAPLFTLVTLLTEAGLALIIWEKDGEWSFPQLDFQPMLDAFWPFFMAFNTLVIPLIVLSMSRKESPVLSELRSRPLGKYHLDIYRFPMGFYLSMGFCMPSLAGDPLNSGLLFGVASALAPVFLVFLVAVAFWRYFEPVVNALHTWIFHWTGKVFIALAVGCYILATLVTMYALRQVPGNHAPYILGAFIGAYLPLRIYLHYWGRGSIVGLVIITAGMVFQQVMLWT